MTYTLHTAIDYKNKMAQICPSYRHFHPAHFTLVRVTDAVPSGGRRSGSTYESMPHLYSHSSIYLITSTDSGQASYPV